MSSKTIFEIYNPGTEHCSRPVTLDTVLSRIGETIVIRTLISQLFRHGHLDEDDLAALIGPGVRVKAWYPVDFCKEHPDEADDMPEGTYTKG
jgi:hypothetical protein